MTYDDLFTLFTGLAQLDQNLVSEINEYYLLHGTKQQLISNIIRDGLDFRMASDKPMFGKGAYCAESSTKADQYAGKLLWLEYHKLENQATINHFIRDVIHFGILFVPTPSPSVESEAFCFWLYICLCVHIHVCTSVHAQAESF